MRVSEEELELCLSPNKPKCFNWRADFVTDLAHDLCDARAEAIEQRAAVEAMIDKSCEEAKVDISGLTFPGKLEALRTHGDMHSCDLVNLRAKCERLKAELAKVRAIIRRLMIVDIDATAFADIPDSGLDGVAIQLRDLWREAAESAEEKP